MELYIQKKEKIINYSLIIKEVDLVVYINRHKLLGKVLEKDNLKNKKKAIAYLIKCKNGMEEADLVVEVKEHKMIGIVEEENLSV